MWMAGAETTVTTLRWALLYMLHHPEVQSKVREEIHAVVGKEHAIGMADRNSLPYTCATINEIQRFANIVPMNELHCTTKDVVLDG